MGLAAGQLVILLLSLSVPQPVRATLADGKSVEGTWAGADQNAVSLRVEDREQRLAYPDLMSLRWTAPGAPPPATRPEQIRVYLTDGSVFEARLTGGDQRQLRVESTIAHNLELPLTTVAAVRLASAADEAAQSAFDTALLAPHPSEDTLLALRDGRLSSVRGALESITPQGVTFRWRNRAMPLPRENVFGIVLAARSGRTSAPATATLHDNSAWAGDIVGGSDTHLQLRLAFGPTVAIPLGQLASVRFRSDRVVLLSDLQPSGYAFEPFMSTQWPWRRDRNVANGPMRLGGETYDRGIGMHTQARLSFELSEPFSQLAATIGIDDSVRPLGSAVFRVLADGKEVFNSGNVTGRDAPRGILVPIGKVRSIELAVDFGEDLDIGDHANWANVRLIK